MTTERIAVSQLPNLKPTYEFPVFRFTHPSWPRYVDICEMSERGAKSWMLVQWKHDQKKPKPEFPPEWPGFEGDPEPANPPCVTQAGMFEAWIAQKNKEKS